MQLLSALDASGHLSSLAALGTSGHLSAAAAATAAGGQAGVVAGLGAGGAMGMLPVLLPLASLLYGVVSWRVGSRGAAGYRVLGGRQGLGSGGAAGFRVWGGGRCRLGYPTRRPVQHGGLYTCCAPLLPHMHTHVHTHTRAHTHTRTCTRTLAHTHTHTHMCAYTRTHARTRTHPCKPQHSLPLSHTPRPPSPCPSPPRIHPGAPQVSQHRHQLAPLWASFLESTKLDRAFFGGRSVLAELTPVRVVAGLKPA